MRDLIYILIMLLFLSCKKDDDTFAPTIEFKSIGPSTVQEYIDDINITISYVDGDGDLGENNPDMYNLFVLDSRNGIKYKFRIPELSPSGNEIAIEGNFNIKINGSGITNGSTSQQVNYDIYVTDRAGNFSNTVSTSSITIVSSTPGVHNPVAVTGHSALREEGHDARMHSHTSNNKLEKFLSIR